MKAIKKAFKNINYSPKCDIVEVNNIESFETTTDTNLFPLKKRKNTECIILKTITSFYIPNSTLRLDEFKECIVKNALPFLEQHIVCEDEKSANIIKSICPSSVVHIINNRPTFSDFIDIIQKDSTDDTIFVLMNSDIIIDETILLLKDINLEKNVVCLQRWERDYKNYRISISPSVDTQDIWCWKKKLNSSNIGKYYMGIPGCDNRFAKELSEQEVECINCPYELISYHNHKESHREYTISKEKVIGDYLLIHPSTIAYTSVYTNPVNLKHINNKNILIVAFPGQSIKKAFEKHKANVVEFNVTSKNVINDLIVFLKNTHIKFDVAFLQFQGSPITIELLITLRFLGIFVIHWTGDARVPLPNWYKIISPYVHIMLFSNEQDIHSISELGYNSAFLNIGYCDNMYSPIGPRLTEGYDVVFMGNNYKNYFELSKFREEMITFLYNKYNDNFLLCGENWNIPCKNLNSNPNEETLIYRSSKMAISISHYSIDRYFSDRMLRIMGCRTLCLAKRYPGIEKDFIDGVHLVVWDTLEDLAKSIDYYKTHPLERMRIAYGGYELVKQKHTWNYRIIELNDILDAYKNEDNKEISI